MKHINVFKYHLLFIIAILFLIAVHESVHYVAVSLDDRVEFVDFDAYPNCGPDGIVCVESKWITTNTTEQRHYVEEHYLEEAVAYVIMMLSFVVIMSIFIWRNKT